MRKAFLADLEEANLADLRLATQRVRIVGRRLVSCSDVPSNQIRIVIKTVRNLSKLSNFMPKHSIYCSWSWSDSSSSTASVSTASSKSTATSTSLSSSTATASHSQLNGTLLKGCKVSKRPSHSSNDYSFDLLNDPFIINLPLNRQSLAATKKMAQRNALQIQLFQKQGIIFKKKVILGTLNVNLSGIISKSLQQKTIDLMPATTTTNATDKRSFSASSSASKSSVSASKSSVPSIKTKGVECSVEIRMEQPLEGMHVETVESDWLLLSKHNSGRVYAELFGHGAPLGSPIDSCLLGVPVSGAVSPDSTGSNAKENGKSRENGKQGGKSSANEKSRESVKSKEDGSDVDVAVVAVDADVDKDESDHDHEQ